MGPPASLTGSTRQPHRLVCLRLIGNPVNKQEVLDVPQAGTREPVSRRLIFVGEHISYPASAESLGRELPVQASEQIDQLAADGPDAEQVRQRRAALY